MSAILFILEKQQIFLVALTCTFICQAVFVTLRSLCCHTDMERETKAENGHKSPEVESKEGESKESDTERDTTEMNGDRHERMSDSEGGDNDESNMESKDTVENAMADLEKKILNDNDSIAEDDNSMPMDTSVEADE